MIVRVPASSANIGPGFDALAMALSLHLELGFGDPADGARAIDAHHPAMKAFHCLGGDGPLWLRSPIPIGRGLGFSGAARVAGAVAAIVQRNGETSALVEAHDEILAVATSLEGHADNVAASLHGGVVATADGHAVRIPLRFDPAVVVWVPPFETSTDQSRATLDRMVAFDDAVFNVARTALLVAALAAGDVAALRAATDDRLHQDIRLDVAEPSRHALEAALDAGAWCGWLSGSGPSVAALCPQDQAESLGAALPAGASVKILRIDFEGAVVEPPT